jgi:hypothetical protein
VLRRLLLFVLARDLRRRMRNLSRSIDLAEDMLYEGTRGRRSFDKEVN